MKKRYSTMLWTGSDEAYEVYASACERALTLDASAYAAEIASSEESLLTVVNGVGVIPIQGVLTDQDAWYNDLLGLVSYSRIQEALARAIADPSVHEVLLDVSSPGGGVNGITETVDAMEALVKSKPVSVFAESVMCSGAVWLTSPVKNKYVGVLACIGSVGVVCKHREISKMLAEAGITETVIRAGEFKQIVNGSEPLNAKSEKVLQDSVDYTYKFFVQTIADHMGITYEKANTMAEGREFTGQQAVDIGLATAVSTFDKVFSELQLRVQKKNKNKQDGGETGMKKRYALTAAEALTAAAEGINLEASADEGEAPTPEEVAAADLLAEQQSAEASNQLAEGAAELIVVEAEPTAMDLLKAQAVEKDEQIFALKTELVSAKAEAGEMASFKAIAAKSISNMTVALGGSAVDLSAASASEIVAQHVATSARFVSEFKVGGVGATSSQEDDIAPVKVAATASRLELVKSKMAVRA